MNVRTHAHRQTTRVARGARLQLTPRVAESTHVFLPAGQQARAGRRERPGVAVVRKQSSRVVHRSSSRCGVGGDDDLANGRRSKMAAAAARKNVFLARPAGVPASRLRAFLPREIFSRRKKSVLGAAFLQPERSIGVT